MNRSSIFALAGGVVGALLYLAIQTGSPGALMLGYFSQLPLFLVGFALGLAPAAIACGVALVGLVAATQVATAALFAGLSVLPVLYVVRNALFSRAGDDGKIVWYPPGLLLAGLTAYGLVVFALAALYYAVAEPGGIEAASREYLGKLFQLSGGSVGASVEALARFVPGAVVASAMLMTVINATLAQGALVRMGKAIRPSPAWRLATLPRWLAFALAAAIVAAFLPDELGVIGGNAAVIAAVPFALVGLAVIHALSARWPARGLALGLMYMTTILLGWPAILIAGLGVVDQWTPLRRMGAGAGRAKEDV
jgi:hypothetical protein